MAEKSLAVKYRPKTWDDVSEQIAIKQILRQQLHNNATKNAYLFCGGAGTGKTTCARIFANEINKHKGNPIELDAASNGTVDDVRLLIQQAKTKSLDSEYKIFIVDECHSISNAGWQAFLKILEEPPAKSIFIFCTTDPQKIPKTILSRVQRYDFQRISYAGVCQRLNYILTSEIKEGRSIKFDNAAVQYLAKIADGGMRDAITLMDKCLAYNADLTEENVVNALGVADYGTMFDLANYIIHGDVTSVFCAIENIHRTGKDLKQFVKSFTNFVLDICKYKCTITFDYIEIPQSYKDELDDILHAGNSWSSLLSTLIDLNAQIKWETSPKAMIEAVLALECGRNT